MTNSAHPLRVLFRVAAGPRVGFGHLVRAVSLAEALGVPATLSVRGPRRSAAATAKRLGAVVVHGSSPGAVIDRFQPDVLAIDDRVLGETLSWRRAARRARVPIVAIHDLGIGVGDADVLVDGSVGAARTGGASRALLGPRYAILNPRTVPTRDGRRPGRKPSPGVRTDVVIALGGGPRRAAALAVARTLLRQRPGLRLAIAGGFVPGVTAPHAPGIDWIEPADLGAALAASRVALVAGGVTLYECLALGVPVVASAVVPSQAPTIAAFARLAVVLDGGSIRSGQSSQAAASVLRLLDDARLQRRQRSRGRRVVDGRGADRVARAIVRLAERNAARKAGAR